MPQKSFEIRLITAGMILLALLVIYARNRFGWFQPKLPADRIYVISQVPAGKSFSASDYIELDQTRAKLMPVHIRVYADGQIERDTVLTESGHAVGCPLDPVDRRIKVSAEDAQRVIATAESKGFSALANSYPASGVVYDAGTSAITLSAEGRVKNVSDHAGSPPPLFGELLDSIWKLSPMDEFVYPWRFSAERKAECEEFQRGNLGKALNVE